MRKCRVVGVSLAVVLSGILAASPAFAKPCYAADENATEEGGAAGSTENGASTETGGSTESSGSVENGESTESGGSAETGTSMENDSSAETCDSTEIGGTEAGGNTENTETDENTENPEADGNTESVGAPAGTEEDAGNQNPILPIEIDELIEEMASPFRSSRMMMASSPMMMLGSSPTDDFIGYDTPMVTPNSVTFKIIPNAGTSYSEMKYSLIDRTSGVVLINDAFPPAGYSGPHYVITQTGLVPEDVYTFFVCKSVGGVDGVPYEYTFSIPAIPAQDHHSSHHDDAPSAPKEDPGAIKLSYSSHESGGSVSATVGSKPLASGMNLISMTGFTVATKVDAEGGAIFSQSPFGGEILTSSVSGKLQEGVANQIVTMTGGVVLTEENVSKLMERAGGGEITLETKVSKDAALSMSEAQAKLAEQYQISELFEINLYANGEKVHDIPVELRLPNTMPGVDVRELVLIAIPEDGSDEEVQYYPLALDPVTGELVASVPHLSMYGTGRVAMNGSGGRGRRGTLLQ